MVPLWVMLLMTGVCLNNLWNKIMNSKRQLITLSILTIFSSISAVSAQNVYEYKNNEGVTEFTDERKENEIPEKNIQIKNRTAEQEAKSKEKLNEIMTKDKELDKQIAKENKLKNKHLKEQQEAKEKKLKQQQSSENGDDDFYYPPGRVRPEHRPKRRDHYNRGQEDLGQHERTGTGGDTKSK